MIQTVKFTFAEEGELHVVPLCPVCKKYCSWKDATCELFLEYPKPESNSYTERIVPEFKNIVCKTHGEVQPDEWFWD